jgi:hypothetical protein
MIWALVLAGVLVACSIGFAYSATGDARERVGVGFTAAAIFLAAAAIGTGVGFLFGLPRARFIDKETGLLAHDDAQDVRTSSRTGAHYLMNTNLIRVSDWLTTILVGITLVQLGNIAPAARNLATNLEAPLGGSDNAGTFGLALVLTAGIGGAVLFYLWTSVRVRELFEASEAEEATVQELLDQELQAHVSKYRKASRHSEADDRTMLRWIRTASPGAKRQTVGELKAARAAISDAAENESIERLMCLFGQPSGWRRRSRSTTREHEPRVTATSRQRSEHGNGSCPFPPPSPTSARRGGGPR